MNQYEKLSNERKELQEKGLAPDWFTTGGYQIFKSKYLYGDNPKEHYMRIAKTLAKHTKDEVLWTDKFFNLLWKGWLSPSTPVLSNTGTNRGLSISCAGNYVEDSVQGFYESLTETAILSKNGFGTSSYLSDIRPRGSKISTGGKSLGVLPVLKMHIQTSIDISQGGVRRGAWAGYLHICHGDFWEVYHYLENNPDDCNIGWIITDEFIQRILNNDHDALDRYKSVLELKAVLGKGYFLFVDKANRLKPQTYKDNDLDIKASNLCVAPETLILTKEYGYKEIASLENQDVHVWNGEEWSLTTVRQTSDNSELIRVTFDDDSFIDCTKEHKFYIVTGARNTKHKKVDAINLKIDDRLIKFNLPFDVKPRTEFNNEAYSRGFYSGDGNRGYNRSSVYQPKEVVIPYLVGNVSDKYDNYNRKMWLHPYWDKDYVPNGLDVNEAISWLEGYFDADGCVIQSDNCQNLQISSIEYKQLQQVKLLLQTLGVYSKITFRRKSGQYMMPKNNGTGENKLYNCKDVYLLGVNGYGLKNLIKIGFSPKRLKINKDQNPQRSANKFIRVKSIDITNRFDTTYCFTEQKRNTGMFNGVLLGNCSEIMLHSSNDYTFTCCLSSMNLSKYDEWKDTDAIFDATVFLDCVVSDFLENAKDIKHLEKAVKFTEKGRAIGLGVMGLFTYFQQKMIDPESIEAHVLNTNIFQHLDLETTRATKWLAKEFGEPEWCKGHGIRNSLRAAIAPTKSTGAIMGGVSEGISPLISNVFTSSTSAGDINRINPVLLDIMKARGVYNESTLSSIQDNKGSVKHVDWLNDHEKNVFKTAYELNQLKLLKMASVRQRYIDQGQSLNLFIIKRDADEYLYSTGNFISNLHLYATLDPYIKGLYYIYSDSPSRAESTVKILSQKNGECESCQ